jgi:hypothetical protein
LVRSTSFGCPGKVLMSIGASLFLVAAGAVLKFATEIYVAGVNFDVIGVILMVVGALGLLVTLAIFAPRRYRPENDYARDRRRYP